MASAALKEEPGAEIPGEDGDDPNVNDQARDFDAEAREHGWRPKDEFPGDATKWVDAETFMKRADEVMPLLKAQNARLKRDYDALRKDLKRATAHFEGAEKRAFDRAKSELETRVEAAIETGDLEAGKAALKEIGELKPVGDEPAKHTKEEAQEALDSFREEHPWYDKANLANASEVEINARLYFDRMIDKNIALTEELAPAEFFAKITDMTLERYPALKGKPARQKPASAVEGGRPGGGRGTTKSWDNLPEQAKKQFSRFIDRGIGVKSTGDLEKDVATAKAYYAKTFDWEGYKE
jgi:hypothetical protein